MFAAASMASACALVLGASLPRRRPKPAARRAASPLLVCSLAGRRGASRLCESLPRGLVGPVTRRGHAPAVSCRVRRQKQAMLDKNGDERLGFCPRFFAASTGAKQPSETPRRRLGPKHACSHASVYMPLANWAIAGASQKQARNHHRQLFVGSRTSQRAASPAAATPRASPQEQHTKATQHKSQNGHALQRARDQGGPRKWNMERRLDG